MTGLDIFSWIVFVVMLISIVGVVLALGQMPGKTAAARNHPQAEAINVAGWLGLLLTMGIVWVVAMIWARTVPADAVVNESSDELGRLRARIAELEAQLITDEEA